MQINAHIANPTSILDITNEVRSFIIDHYLIVGHHNIFKKCISVFGQPFTIRLLGTHSYKSYDYDLVYRKDLEKNHQTYLNLCKQVTAKMTAKQIMKAFNTDVVKMQLNGY